MKSINQILLGLCGICCMASSCSLKGNKSYYDVPYKADEDISCGISIIDTLRIDGSTSSLSGIWLSNNGKLYFCDNNMVSIKEYDKDGNFLQRIIRSGRGPGEWYSPFVYCCFDTEGKLYCVDGMWNILNFSPELVLSDNIFRLMESSYLTQDWNDLRNHPDPENINMYEYNVERRGLAIMGDKLVFPIVTDHIEYNGYDTRAHSKDFWQNSYNMMFAGLDDDSYVPFSHFPGFYQSGNYPLYSEYCFDVRNDSQLLVSYMSDPKIYVFDSNCDLSYAFGIPSKEVNTKGYRQTEDFKAFEKYYSSRMTGISGYGYIKCIGDYTFRTYKSDKAYGIQIYSGDSLTGDAVTSEEWKVFGSIDDVFYASLTSDYQAEEHRIIRFELKQ